MKRGAFLALSRWLGGLTPPKITAVYLSCSILWLALVQLVMGRSYERPQHPWYWVSWSVDALGVACTATIVYFLCARLEARHLASEDRIREQAARDGLTGLYNRQAFDELLVQSLQHAKRHGESLVVM